MKSGFTAALALLWAGSASVAQEPGPRSAVVAGRVIDAASGAPMSAVTLLIEGSARRAISDSTGAYRIVNVPAGPQVLRAQRLGYAPSRNSIIVPVTGSLVRDIQMARRALELKGVEVNADPTSRARGELGTASVIEREAIRNQVAASLAGVLELVPGVPLQAPGLDNVQQISLRSVPISSGAVASNRTAENLASFGTLIVLDGVPVSNNANLQGLGAAAQLSFNSAAGGGVDLRRIPAATLERVEVIRGIASARFGDLTNGAIVVDTRAGEVEPGVSLRADAYTTEVSLFGGKRYARDQTATLTSNLARTNVGTTGDDESTRLAAQFAHQLVLGGTGVVASSVGDARLVLDTRIDGYSMTENRPESPALPGTESYDRSAGARLLERMRIRLRGHSRLELTSAYERGVQRSRSRADLLRGATPVTDRIKPGRQEGRFVAGVYNAAVTADGRPAQWYSRLELAAPADFAGFAHEARLGAEVRRESNTGNGVQFDIEEPPQSLFNGVQGFDRPRSFRDIPALATSALYADDRISRPVLGGMLLNVQAGARLDALHQSGTPWSGVRDLVVQPRINLELAPALGFRIRAGAGRFAKTPALSDLYPSPDYYDVINVNYFADNPDERLAVLTTFINDPTNPELGYAVSDRTEAGLEFQVRGTTLSVTGFADRVTGAFGTRPETGFITREHYDLMNATPGSGQPPEIIEPASSVDTVPVLIRRPSNNVTERGNGVEFVADFPEIPMIRTRVAFQGAWVKSRLHQEGPEFPVAFGDFQLSETQQRSPYYESIVRTGERILLNTRVVHQQPEIGLVITGTLQHTLREIRQNVGGTDSLAFVGYVTRMGALVPVPAEQRSNTEFSDLRIPRIGVQVSPAKGAVDWIFSLQVSKTLPRDGRLSFYAFNAFDRVGRYGTTRIAPRVFLPTRFGVELTFPIPGMS